MTTPMPPVDPDTSDEAPTVWERFLAIQRQILSCAFGPRVVWIWPALLIAAELLSFTQHWQQLARLDATAAYARAKAETSLSQSPRESGETREAVNRSASAAIEAVNAHRTGYRTIFQPQLLLVVLLCIFIEVALVAVIAARLWWVLVTAGVFLAYKNIDNWFPPPLEKPTYGTITASPFPVGPKPDEATDFMKRAEDSGCDAIDFADAKSLPPESALVLARFRGDLLFDNLTSLSLQTAANLATHEGVLSLNGLKSLSDEAAIALAKHRGPIRLTGLVECTPHAMEMLKSKPTTKTRSEGWRGWIRFLLRVIALFGLFATATSLITRARVSWCGKSATAETVSTPACYSFDHITTLSLRSAQKFANLSGNLSLNGLTAMSNEAARALAKHAGSLSLNGLTTLSVEAADVLAIDNHLSLDGLKTLSADVAGALAFRDNRLSLNGLSAIAPDVAEALSVCRSILKLNGLRTLSPEVATALAQHNGALSLDGVTSLSDEAAVALSRHSGPISLKGLVDISEKAAKVLRERGGVAIGRDLGDQPPPCVSK